MEHSYEEIRAAALDILAGREETAYLPNQFGQLSGGVAEVLLRRELGREEAFRQMHQQGRQPRLGRGDSELFQEVFWDLFRQGIITLGLDDANPQFPFFRVSRAGQNIIENQGVYFFHDISSYTTLLNNEIPTINPVTLLYLQEAMQAFRAGCMLSATVMLGVAAEHTFYLVLDVLDASPSHQATFKAVFAERTILQKLNKFRNILEQQLKALPPEIKEDLDTHFAGILSVIRTFRNQSGHPSGKIIAREQVYILLQLFIPYCRKMYQLMDFYK